MFVIHANLDAEARWAGVALPARVLARLAATAPLLAALAPPGEQAEIWAPAAVDPARLRAAPGLPAPVLRVGAPPRADLAWADPAARGVNSRRAGLALAAHLGLALPGARAVTTLAELDAAAAALGGAPWVAKAIFTAAGRDRALGRGALAGELRQRAANLFARHGALVFEPWLDRIADAGACAVVSAEDVVAVTSPHGLATDARGGFAGIDTAADGLLPAERAHLQATAETVAAMLSRAGYRGPVGLDAFAYRAADGSRRFHPLCEVNARHTFGAVAHALAARLGAGHRRLGFGPPPAGATILVAPAADPFCAWMSA